MSLETGQDVAVLEAFFENSPIGFSVLDEDFRYVRINRALSDINGHPVEATLGRRQDEIVPHVDPIIRMVQERVLKEGLPSLGHVVQAQTAARPGVLRKFDVDYFPLHDLSGRRLVGSCVYETSESLEFVEALQRQTQRAREQIDPVNFFLGNLDAEGRMTHVNAPALALLDATMDDVRGVHFWDCGWWTHDGSMQERIRTMTQASIAGQVQRADCVVATARGTKILVDVQIAPLRREDGGVEELVASGVDVTDRHEAQQHRDILFAELQHRVTNIFTTVKALSHLMAARFDELAPYLEAFDNKLSSLARTNSALLHNHWSAMDVHGIVKSECSPFLDLHDEAVVVEGPNLRVEGRNAAMLGLAIHELATNAAKHGALSDGAGTVQVEFDGQDGAGLSHFLWRERGGPKVSRGDRTGFGSVLLEEIVPDALGLEAEIAFDEDGVTYRLGAHTR